MAIIENANIKVLTSPGTVFGADIQTTEVLMDNAQAAHFVIASGEGETKEVKVQIMAKCEGVEQDPILIREEDITIGGNTETKIVVAARELCKEKKCAVYLVIPNADAPTLVGSIIVLLTNERYSS